jgi:hypothetical protein
VEKDNLNALGATRRSLLVGSGVAITALAGTHAVAAVSASTHPPVAEPVAGPYPVPPEGKTAGPILPNRGSSLAGKVAVVTGAAPLAAPEDAFGGVFVAVLGRLDLCSFLNGQIL